MEHLTAAVETLTESVKELSTQVDLQHAVIKELKTHQQEITKQQRGLHSTRIVVAAASIVVLLNFVLTIGGVGLYQRVVANQHQIQANQNEIQQVQQRTSSEILCPLYLVFATGIKMNPPSPNLTPDQAKARQDLANTILSGLDKLGCA